jgi:hypothetical protein
MAEDNAASISRTHDGTIKEYNIGCKPRVDLVWSNHNKQNYANDDNDENDSVTSESNYSVPLKSLKIESDLPLTTIRRINNLNQNIISSFESLNDNITINSTSITNNCQQQNDNNSDQEVKQAIKNHLKLNQETIQLNDSIYSHEDSTWNSDVMFTTSINHPLQVIETTHSIYSKPDQIWIENHSILNTSERIETTTATTISSNDEDELDVPHNSSQLLLMSRRQAQHKDKIPESSPHPHNIFASAAATVPITKAMSSDEKHLSNHQQNNIKNNSNSNRNYTVNVNVGDQSANIIDNRCSVPPLPYNRPHTYTHRLIKYNPIVFSCFQWTTKRMPSQQNRGSILLVDENIRDNISKNLSNDDNTTNTAFNDKNYSNVRQDLSLKISKLISALLCCGSSSLLIYGISISTVTLLLLAALTKKAQLPQIEVAMIGNSMMYYNDLPRFIGTYFCYIFDDAVVLCKVQMTILFE